MHQIKTMKNQLIKERYLTVGSLLLFQCRGIPRGIRPADFWADLYLYDYETDVISVLIKTDEPRVIKFKNASRFVDDECNLNNSGEFCKSCRVHVVFIIIILISTFKLRFEKILGIW